MSIKIYVVVTSVDGIPISDYYTTPEQAEQHIADLNAMGYGGLSYQEYNLEAEDFRKHGE